MSSPNAEPSGPPLRALAMVLISLAILFAAIGALALTDSGDSDDAAAAPAAVDTTTPAPSAAASAGVTSAAAAPTTSASPATVEVRVLNNSNISGLAAQAAESLTSAGYTVAETGNYSDTQVPQTTVYYGTSAAEREAAQEIATVLGVSAQARPSALANAGSGVLVLVTQ